MREVEMLENEISEIDTSLQGIKDELQVFEKTASENLVDYTEQLAKLQQERLGQAQTIGNSQALILYNRVVGRFPADPIVDVVNRDSCAGCFMKVGPQVPVQISRGDVVKCPGCGRILKLPAES
jgi:predicted  nucleic acid-binding Zn-ribbon protein